MLAKLLAKRPSGKGKKGIGSESLSFEAVDEPQPEADGKKDGNDEATPLKARDIEPKSKRKSVHDGERFGTDMSEQGTRRSGELSEPSSPNVTKTNGKGLKEIHRGILWKLNNDADPADEAQWLQREMWINASGSLCYFSSKQNKNLVLLDAQRLQNATVAPYTGGYIANAFQVEFKLGGQDQLAPVATNGRKRDSVIFGCQSPEEMQIWMESFTSLKKVGNHEGTNGQAKAAKNPATNGNGFVQPDAMGAATGASADETISGLKVNSFDVLEMAPDLVREVKFSWKAYIATASSREAAGEAIFTAVFESAPSLQSLFTTPRAVQAMRFMSSLGHIVASLDSPKELKMVVETLGFGHMNVEVTIPRAVVFRDAILELLELELGPQCTPEALAGWTQVLNYIGGALVYVRTHYADRIRILTESWAIASHKEKNVLAQASSADEQKDQDPQNPQEGGRLEHDHQEHHQEHSRLKDRLAMVKKGLHLNRGSHGHSNHNGNGMASGGHEAHQMGGKSPNDSGEYAQDKHSKDGVRNTSVPTTYNEMFVFNAAVMGFGNKVWLNEILNCFDAIVSNVADSQRMQQECDVLALRISKGNSTLSGVNLSQYKSCMLASLRSLLPKTWDSSHEVAWNWLWENVERLLKQTIDQPPAWEAALSRFFESLDESTQYAMRTDTYARFFDVAPAGQDFFKQSTTRLHFIADRIMNMTLEFFANPWRMGDEISALGLRHVAYGIPTELFGPFVNASVEVVTLATSDAKAVEAYRWCLGLITKMLVRTINEGSTIVMKAINVDSGKQIKKAVTCAPRGLRARWLLLVQVGTQSISPLSWALESGSLDAAQAIIEDLTTIRADRERYYYGVEELFERHSNIVQRLCTDAPTILPHFFDGLIWRSRFAKDGMRRTNYYVKHLLIDPEGRFNECLKYIISTQDPTLISHPTVDLVSETLWNGIVYRQFILSKVWFLASLATFMLSQAVFPKSQWKHQRWCLILTFAGRLIMYLGTMMRLLFTTARAVYFDCKKGNYVRIAGIPITECFSDPYRFISFLLAIFLVCMCAYEPMFYCIAEVPEDTPTEACDSGRDVEFAYSVFCMVAMFLHWWLLVDMAVFRMGLSAFRLVCVNVTYEINKFVVALSFLLLTFASAICVLDHTYPDMQQVPQTFVALFSITVRLYEDDFRDMRNDPALLTTVFVFLCLSVILLLNLLIAQLNCSYVYVYADMLGFARLKRAETIVELLLAVGNNRTWTTFVESLKLEEPLEFNEGDVGMAGGLQKYEPASKYIVANDTILRFGGSSDPSLPWPEVQDDAEEDDRVERMERLLLRSLKRMRKQGKAGGSSASSSTAGSDMSGSMHSSASSAMSSMSETED